MFTRTAYTRPFSRLLVGFFLAIALLSLSVGPASAQPSEGEELLRLLVEEQGGIWQMTLDAKRRMPRLVLGKGSASRGTKLVDHSQYLLSRYGDWLDLPAGPQGLRFDSTSTSRLGSHLLFRQWHDGYPIEGAGITVHMSPKAEFRGFTNRTIARPRSLSHTFRDPESALDLALQSLAKNRSDVVGYRIEKIWWAKGELLAPAMRIDLQLNQLEEGAWLFFVSATGRNEIFFAKPMQFSAKGRGRIFPENLLATPGILEVELPHMDKTKQMQGQYAIIYDAEFRMFVDLSEDGLAQYTRAFDPGRNFLFDPDEPEFSQVMGYYHVNRARDFLVREFNLKFSKKLLRDTPIFVNLNGFGGVGLDNAFFSRSSIDGTPSGAGPGYLAFGAGNLFANFSHDSDVIYHEYGHKILDHLQPELIEPAEHNYGGAIHESFGDILAARLNGNSKIGEHALALRHDGQWLGRDLDNNRKYPQDVILPELGTSEVHYSGEILNGVWWDIAQQIGAETAFEIWFESLGVIPPDATFFDIRDAVLAVNELMRDGADNSLIQSTFSARGIVGSDPGNRGSLSPLRLRTATINDRGKLRFKKKFPRLESNFILVFLDYQSTATTPGYFIIPELLAIEEPLGGENSIRVVSSPFPEARNGTHKRKNGAMSFIMFNRFNARAGTYTIRGRFRLGGTEGWTESIAASFVLE